jgi:hypothetical protein
VSTPRWLPWAHFVFLSLAALSFTPIAAGFAIRSAFECEISASAQLWIDSIPNIRHLVSFSALTVVAVWAFGTRNVWPAAAVVLLLTGLVEVEQMVFADGHCRLRNMLPNVIAIGIGVTLALLIARVVRTRPA